MTITIDYTSAQTCCQADSYASGSDVFLNPRQTLTEQNGTGWLQVSTRVTGVNNITPRFRVRKSGLLNKPWYQGVGSQGYFTYDRLAWTPMGLAMSDDGTYFNCQHSAAFTQDEVWFSRFRFEGVYQMQNWLSGLAQTYSNLIANLQGGSNFIVDWFSPQIDERGYTVAATPLLGFRINDGSAAKRRFLLATGVHASEQWGSTCFKKCVEFVLGNSAEAIALRKQFEFICLPQMNAPGREGGHNRGQFQTTAGWHNDLNRHFSDSADLFETISKNRAVIAREMRGPGLAAGALDFHTQSAGPASAEQGYYEGMGSPLEYLWRAAFQARGGYQEYGWNPGGTMIGWAISDLGVRLGQFVEHNDDTTDSDSAATTLGQRAALTLYDILGSFGEYVGEVLAPAETTDANNPAAQRRVEIGWAELELPVSTVIAASVAEVAFPIDVPQASGGAQYRVELSWAELALPVGAVGSRELTDRMMRNTSAVITEPGFLVEIDFDPPVCLSSRDTVSWNGAEWAPWHIRLAGLAFDGTASSQNGSLTLGNTDLSLSSAILLNGVSGRQIRIWAFYGADPDDADPVLIFSGIGDSAAIDPDSGMATITLQQEGGLTLYCPRTYINRASGHNYVPPVGTKITWGNEIFELKAE